MYAIGTKNTRHIHTHGTTQVQSSCTHATNRGDQQERKQAQATPGLILLLNGPLGLKKKKGKETTTTTTAGWSASALCLFRIVKNTVRHQTPSTVSTNNSTHIYGDTAGI